MAIYHLSVKPISRSAGRSSTAAAAYRAAVVIEDRRTGEVHDFTRKQGVESADIVLPAGAAAWAADRAELWNAAELAERRKDACVAREYEVALPAELSAGQRRALALEFAREMADAEGCAVDVAIHAPGRGGDDRNHHAHIMRTTRKVGPDGLGEKLDTEKAGRKRRDDLDAVRERWAALTNAHLLRAGVALQVDHRSLEHQGIDRAPTQHLGPAATGFERRTGQVSRLRQRHDADEVARRLRMSHEAGLIAREIDAASQSVIDISGDLRAAKLAKQAMSQPEIRAAAKAGVKDFRNAFEAHKRAVEQAKRDEQRKQQRRGIDPTPPRGRPGPGFSR